MLQQILALCAEAGGAPLSKAAMGRHLGVEPAVLDHMLETLVRKGRLVAVGPEACTGCPACPLKSICAGGPAFVQAGYLLAR